RRHTRSKRDWSSDVCSSDLNIIGSFMGYAYRAGYTVHISGYEYSPETEREHLRNLETGKPGTVVVIFNGNNDEEEIRRLIKRDKIGRASCRERVKTTEEEVR